MYSRVSTPIIPHSVKRIHNVGTACTSIRAPDRHPAAIHQAEVDPCGSAGSGICFFLRFLGICYGIVEPDFRQVYGHGRSLNPMDGQKGTGTKVLVRSLPGRPVQATHPRYSLAPTALEARRYRG